MSEARWRVHGVVPTHLVLYHSIEDGPLAELVCHGDVDPALVADALNAAEPINRLCSLCGIKMSTGDCLHLLDLGDGRVAMDRGEWEGLVNDRLQLRREHETDDEVEDYSPKHMHRTDVAT